MQKGLQVCARRAAGVCVGSEASASARLGDSRGGTRPRCLKTLGANQRPAMMTVTGGIGLALSRLLNNQLRRCAMRYAPFVHPSPPWTALEVLKVRCSLPRDYATLIRRTDPRELRHAAALSPGLLHCKHADIRLHSACGIALSNQTWSTFG